MNNKFTILLIPSTLKFRLKKKLQFNLYLLLPIRIRATWNVMKWRWNILDLKNCGREIKKLWKGSIKKDIISWELT